MTEQSDPATARIRTLHHVSDIGFRRRMEDRHVVQVRPRLGLFAGVYDGHGGDEAVEAVAASLHEVFFQALECGLSPSQAFQDAYRIVEQQLGGIDSGATAVTIFLRNDELHFAHAGDGGILLVADGPILLTEPHRVDNPVERSRIITAGGHIEGGYVVRGHRGLMPTRSFGDAYFRPVGVMAEPTLGGRRLGVKDRYLIVACDGLFDVLAAAEIAEVLQRSSGARQGCESLRDEVLGRGGTDNLTILVIEFDTARDPSVGDRDDHCSS
jgi:serine/threonine protein phosphatase PrpC